MNNQSLLSKDIDTIIKRLDLEQNDLRIEVKDHLMCLVKDKMDLDDELDHKQAILTSKYEIMSLVKEAKETLEDDKRFDLIKIVLDAVKGDSIFISLGIAAVIFVFYNLSGYIYAGDIEMACIASIAVFIFVRIRIRKRRRKADTSFSNKIIRRYSFVPILSGLGIFLISAVISRHFYHILMDWNLEFLVSLPISVTAFAAGVYIKILLDCVNKIPDLISDQAKVDRALIEIGCVV